MKLDSTRERRPTHGFGWVDRRVVKDGHLAALTSSEAAVYLVLCVVADRHGISYYHPGSLGKLVHHPESHVREALKRLAERGLIATAGRFVQVVPLELVEPAPALGAKTPVAAVKAHPVETAVGSQERSDRACPEPPEEAASEVLARLPAARREELMARARNELAKFMGHHEPGLCIVEGLAASLSQQKEQR